jgi:hypothetical protein
MYNQTQFNFDTFSELYYLTWKGREDQYALHGWIFSSNVIIIDIFITQTFFLSFQICKFVYQIVIEHFHYRLYVHMNYSNYYHNIFLS